MAQLKSKEEKERRLAIENEELKTQNTKVLE